MSVILPLRLWRLAWNKANAFAAFSAGAAEGRFNPYGTGVLYTSTTLPLAVLEVLAHWDDYHNFNGYGVYTTELTEALAEPGGPPVFEVLPDGFPVTDKAQCQDYGLDWANNPQTRSLALVVPSVLMPGVVPERNVILNPSHTYFDALSRSFVSEGPFTLDSRIYGSLNVP